MSLILLLSAYVAGAAIAGGLTWWIDTNSCPCCDAEPSRHGWWFVLGEATIWPWTVLKILAELARGRV